jgi:hypothetical protein
MTRVDLGGKAALIAAVAAICASVTACGGSSGSAGSSTTGSITQTPFTGNASAALITGSPVTTATVGQAYSFQPTVSGTTGTLKFSITHTPGWAKFDSSTGKLTGTPSSAQVGTYAGITISVVDSKTSGALPAFSIVVGDANPSNVTLSWQPPTENADGSPLVDLKGYKVHYGASSKSYSDTIQVGNAGLTTYVVQNLAAGKYYFAITAYNSAGHESSLSSEVATQVD